MLFNWDALYKHWNRREEMSLYTIREKNFDLFIPRWLRKWNVDADDFLGCYVKPYICSFDYRTLLMLCPQMKRVP